MCVCYRFVAVVIAERRVVRFTLIDLFGCVLAGWAGVVGWWCCVWFADDKHGSRRQQPNAPAALAPRVVPVV